MIYQKDIDGLRSIAVLAVVFFHIGFLEYGYLGVDVFFVISGYLITTKIYNKKKFSLKDFYKRRIRRILPLTLVISTIALIIGFFVMLPDDLENLSQSVIATNFSINNLLLLRTTGDYWNVLNEYKPLMHTWSLGVEEQFYIFYPLIFIFFRKNKIQKRLIILLTITSFVFFIFTEDQDFVFFTLITRFWEIAIGGLVGIFYYDKKISNIYKNLAGLTLIFLLCFLTFGFNDRLGLLITVLVSLIMVIPSKDEKKLFYSNQILRYIGKISFSIYLWHQLLLAYYRYIFTDELSICVIVIYLILTFLLSVLTYNYVEDKFRNYKKVSLKNVLFFVIFLFITSSLFSFYLIKRRGIVRDVPELNILNIDYEKIVHHNQYNDRVRKLTNQFSKNSTKTKVLVIGDSFARDFSNILLEIRYNNKIEIRYIHTLNKKKEILLKHADIIFFCREDGVKNEEVFSVLDIHKKDYYIVGSKNFSNNMGPYYNRLDKKNCSLRAKLNDRVLKINKNLKSFWGNKYIDMVDFLKDDKNTLPVFTQGCNFISQDSKHLTESGAIYYSKKLEKRLTEIIKK
jgi:peptidoglycan/LPS O-acetylase OafA/YrhL